MKLIFRYQKALHLLYYINVGIASQGPHVIFYLFFSKMNYPSQFLCLICIDLVNHPSVHIARLLMWLSGDMIQKIIVSTLEFKVISCKMKYLDFSRLVYNELV